MENKDAKTKSFELRYTALMLWVIAGLLLASIGYTTRLWGIKAGLAALLVGLGIFFLSRSFNPAQDDA
jgi:predicted membrane protein